MDRIGKFTSLERWLLSGARGQEAETEAGPDGRKGSNRKEKEFDRGLVGNSQHESKEGITGGGKEPACPGKEETLSQ